MRIVSIVIPMHNEEQNVRVLGEAILSVTKGLNYHFEIIYVDDGSVDQSLEIVKQMCQEYDAFYYIKLARNYGHQNALKAGIDMATGDCVISMDADMQHPPALIPVMIQKWDEEGYDLVYTRRHETDDASFFKNHTSSLFYKVMNLLSEVKLEEGTADFRLMDNRICNYIRESKEAELFFRALVTLTGFKQYALDYTAAARHAGKSKFGPGKMLQLALQGITSYSVKPLHFATYLGLLFAFGALLYFPYILFSYITHKSVGGWSSILTTIVFFGGLQLFVLGIIGIYIGKIFTQVKQRPMYRVQETNIYAADHLVKF